MIYQFYHNEETFESCESSALNTPWGIGESIYNSTNRTNINNLNKELCEWTGIFDVWKNEVNKHNWIGVSHYRRPAPSSLRKSQGLVDNLLNNYQAITWHSSTIYIKKHVEYHHGSLWNLLDSLVRYNFSDEEIVLYESLLNRPMIHPLANCFIMKSVDFEAYCNWVWKIINPIVLKISENPVELFGLQLKGTRVMAYICEYLFPIYVKLHLKNVLMMTEVGAKDSHPIIVAT
tara:strand:+ start:1192 stop:1890 length:699 start_codon:yes stop_codon:yes gene_type:complete